MARVVVVGGGFAGLAVAARLARGRHRVVVLDRAAELGGRLRDPGADSVPPLPVTFTMPAVLRDLFRKTGKPIEDVLELEPVDPARRYVFADGTVLDLPSGNRAETIAAVDSALGSGAGADWESLLLQGRQMWEVLRRDVVEAPLTRTGELVPLLRQRAAFRTVRPGRSLAGIAGSTLPDPRSRALLGTYATAIGGDPRRAPAALAMLPYLEHAFGVWQVAGGPAQLIAALADRALLRGAELRPGADVAALTVDGGRVTGVDLSDGEHLDAEVVVAAIDVRAAARLVHGASTPWRSPRRQGPGASRFTAALQPPADRTVPHLSHPVETVYLGPDPDAEIRVVRHRSDTADRWTVSSPTAAYEPARGRDWRAEGVAVGYARTLVETLAERGLDLRSWHLTGTETPADIEDRTGAPGGALDGPPPHGLAGALVRAANQSGVSGLYAVGSSAHPGPGLPFVGLSAALVNDLIGPAPRANRATS